MADERWHQIFDERITPDLPPTSKHQTPRVNRPICENDCSGTHKVESVIGCRKCKSAAYLIIEHEYKYTEGHYFYELHPQNGAREEPPLTHCTCGEMLVRV